MRPDQNGAGCAGQNNTLLEGCAKAQVEPTPQTLLRDRARSLRAETNRLEILANSLPGLMPTLANDALVEIILRRPIF